MMPISEKTITWAIVILVYIIWYVACFFSSPDIRHDIYLDTGSNIERYSQGKLESVISTVADAGFGMPPYAPVIISEDGAPYISTDDPWNMFAEYMHAQFHKYVVRSDHPIDAREYIAMSQIIGEVLPQDELLVRWADIATTYNTIKYLAPIAAQFQKQFKYCNSREVNFVLANASGIVPILVRQNLIWH